MKAEGGCYCGSIRYEIDAEPVMNAQCHCRECVHVSGGSPNVIVGIPENGFKYVKGTPKQFRRADLETPVTREFCADCGTPILSKAPAFAGVNFVKLGSLDNPSAFGDPQLAIFTVDKQSFHTIREGMPSFERLPDM